MAEPRDRSQHIFSVIPHFDPEALRKTWNLRSQFPPPYSTDLIKSRPPYLRATFTTDPQAKEVINHYFRGLRLRDGSKDGIFGRDGYRHLLFLYELEGDLVKGIAPGVDQLLAGMNHFAQYMQDVVHIIQRPIKISNTKLISNLTRIPVPKHLDKKRLIIFLVQNASSTDDDNSLCWYDQKQRKAFLLETSKEDLQIAEKGLRILEDTVGGLVDKGGCLQMKEGITRVPCTRQLSEEYGNGLLLINNLRMLLLENQEMMHQNQYSGYIDWTYSLFFTLNIAPQQGTKEDAIKDMMITAIRIELGQKGRPLRWPDYPTIDENLQVLYAIRDDTKRMGATFQSNSSLRKEGTKDLPEPSVEDAVDLVGRQSRSVSVMASHAFALSRMPTVNLEQGSARGSPEVGLVLPQSQPPNQQRSQSVRLQTPSSAAQASPRMALPNMEQLIIRPPGLLPRAGETTRPEDTQRKAASIGPVGSWDQQGPPDADQDDPGAALDDMPPPPRPRRGVSSRHAVPEGYHNNLRPRTRRASPPPVDPQYQYLWYEAGSMVVQPGCDPDFKGWDYMMRKEDWDRRHSGN